MRLPLILLGCLLLVVAGSACFARDFFAPEAPSAMTRLERIQEETPFRIILPEYLPEGFSMTDVFKDPQVNDTIPGVGMYFVDQDYENAFTIRQFGQPIHPVFFDPFPGREIKEVRGYPVRVSNGRFTRRIRADGVEERLEGVTAGWNYNNNSFDIGTHGVFWDEVEKIIASMIE